MSAQNLYDILEEQGFVYQCTGEPALRELFGQGAP